jgi:hypothetical protein
VSHKPSDHDGLPAAAIAHHLRTSAADDACPDAEALAVYFERRADPDERGHIESHVASCARCQAHLAALVRSEPASETPESWWPALALPWRFFVPIASAALVVLSVWIARTPTPEPSVDQVAEQAPPPVADSRQATPTAPPVRSPALERKDANETAPRGEDAKARREEASEAQSLAARSKAGGVSGRLEDANRPAAGPPAPATLKAAEETATISRASPSRAAPAAAAPTETERAAVGEQRGHDRDASRDLASSARFWRVTGGAVERSLDGGASWIDRYQPSGATLRAVAGPSPVVAWAVGDDGAVFRTTDGAQWTSVAFPERVPLVAVAVTSAQHAVVTAADGRRFATEDGGLSWREM